MSYGEWKDLAQERNTYINRVSEFAKYPDKVMHLTGNASVVPPAGKTNHAFKSEASKNGIMIESIAKAKGKGKSFEYAKWQTLNGRDFMPSVKAVRKIALEIYERKFNQVKPR